MLHSIWISLRPRQWLKNVIVFAGLFFAEDFLVLSKILDTLAAFLLFCLVSSSGYLVNDVIDRRKDALHPHKRLRPIAAGRLAPGTAIALALLLSLGSLAAAWALNRVFFLILAAYLIFTYSYSLLLKRVIILDVLLIASGFVLRAIGGTIAARETVSSWLIICTIFLSLFLALTKRRSEVKTLGAQAAQVRSTLGLYTLELLDQMIDIVTAACLMAYALYTLDAGTVEKFGTRNLAFTLPFVIYGLFRYLYLVLHLNIGETPEAVLLHDRPIMICILAYIGTVASILYI
ncbi:MAG TPA: decaprenyl-phosphate phosphoribosyltransferase [bacterium]|nr:decaprenyl-phosphate phosphoribosyltransferase [bacterium]HQG44383.1 decaprenyl-phosphate phosphoribosyltransferase [bacterium]HQI47284.1 decaprenyl-phosphate phosphoribosyltransferase [bacterium]HQJ63771.1 decaprenyl-phosphate phosphoribosyltransferase [bacterium]